MHIPSRPCPNGICDVSTLLFFLQYVHHLQRKYSLGSFHLLGHTAPAQAASLLIFGPFVDLWLTDKRVDTFGYTMVVTVRDALF